MERLREIYNTERTKRVAFYRRSPESFSFIEERWSDDEYERCWILGRWPDSICDSLETAIREATERIEWLGSVATEKLNQDSADSASP